MSSDAYSYCKLCRVNHTLKRKHVFTKKHKEKVKSVLQKYGKKIKECRPYLNDPVIQEGDFEPEAEFWCHCCNASYKKHVTDHLKTILYGGVIEHLASEEHWICTEEFFKENGADENFKISFIVSQTDLNLYKAKLEPLVDVFNARKDKKTAALAKEIESREVARKVFLASVMPSSSSSSSREVVYKTVKNKHGVIQNPTGYHDGVRVWKGGVVKYKKGSNQSRPPLYPCKKQGGDGRRFGSESHKVYTVSAESDGLTAVAISFDTNNGNIHSGAVPPWLRPEKDESHPASQAKMYGPSADDLQKYLDAKKKSKLNPNRVGVNFDHAINRNDANWLPSFGRVWNQGARWKSRHEYRREVKEETVTKKSKKQ